MSTRKVTRKRSRAEFDQEDELASEVEQTPLSTAKRKKANSAIPSSAKGSVFGSIRQKVGGLLGYQQGGKENGSAEKDEDELADDEVTTPRAKKPVKDIFDVPSSPEEERRLLNRSVSTKTKAPQSVKKTYSTKGKGSASKQPASSPDKQKPAVRQPSPDIPKRKRGRPRKSDILKQAKQLSNKATREKMMAEKEEDETEDEAEDAATLSRKDDRRIRKEGVPPNPMSVSKAPSTARKPGRPARDQLAVPGSTQELKSALTPTKKKRGRPRKSVVFAEFEELDLGFKDIPDSASAKKSIKNKIIERSENVPNGEESEISEPSDEVGVVIQVEDQSDSTEDGDEDDVACTVCSELHSEDNNPMLLCDECANGAHMKCSNLRKVPKGTWLCPECTTKSDDISCGICATLKSTKKNPMILCSGCDNGIHLNCSDMTDVPEDDWFCQDCKPVEALSTKGESEKIKLSRKLPDIDGFDTYLGSMQRVVLDRLTGQKRIKLIGQDDEMQKVYQVVEQTIVAGEGNSMLVIGARGSGKTTLVEQVISDLSPNHRENFHVVRLNGFIHTDDKLALKEIWRQLGREMEVEDETNGKSNYADTLASLLALLSHPSEMSESNADQTAKSVIFILDEFDLFTTHSRQTLLYNLFDIAQARKAPIVVLGLTTHVDVVESLEKRVKSRFSHRYVHLSLPRSLPAFWEICREGLTTGIDEIGTEADNTNDENRDKFMACWQNMIEDLYKSDEIFKHHIQSQFYKSKSAPAFFTSCILPLANISTTNFPLTGKDFHAHQSLSAPDSKLQLLQGLAELEIALLIAAARLDIIQDTDTCNFAMAYDEYSSLTSRHKIQTSSTGVAALGSSAKVWGRDVALGAWERLADYGLLVPAGIGGGGAARDFGAGGRMWKVDVGLEEITGSVEGLSTVMAKWCREI